MKVRVLGSIREVDRRAWDSLVGDDPVFRHGWFRALERARLDLAEPRHLLLEVDGAVAGIVPCFLQHSDPHATLIRRLLGRAADFASERALVAYSPLSQRSEWFLRADVDRVEALTLVRECMDSLCREERIWIAGWPFRSHSHSDPGSIALRSSGFCTGFLAPSAVWSNAGYASFDAYLHTLKSRGRRRYRAIRNELNRVRRANVEIDDRPLHSACAAELARLHAVHYREHNPARDCALGAEFFDALQSELGDTARLHGAYDESGLATYSIVLTSPTRWHMFLSGDRDHESAHRDKIHFTLNYYFPMQCAIESKVARLDYGLSTYAAKMWRGCSLEPVSFAVRAPSPMLQVGLRGLSALVDRWYQHKHRGFAHEGPPLAASDTI